MQKPRRTAPTTESAVESHGNDVHGVDGPSSESQQGPAPNRSLAQRAYERYEQRGREHGRDLDDWLEAERELLNNQE
jgi:hypothetical protein